MTRISSMDAQPASLTMWRPFEVIARDGIVADAPLPDWFIKIVRTTSTRTRRLGQFLFPLFPLFPQTHLLNTNCSTGITRRHWRLQQRAHAAGTPLWPGRVRCLLPLLHSEEACEFGERVRQVPHDNERRTHVPISGDRPRASGGARRRCDRPWTDRSSLSHPFLLAPP